MRFGRGWHPFVHGFGTFAELSPECPINFPPASAWLGGPIPAQDVEIAMASDCRSQVLGTTRLNKSHCRRGSQAMRDVATLTNPAQHYFDFFAQALRRGNRLAP